MNTVKALGDEASNLARTRGANTRTQAPRRAAAQRVFAADVFVGTGATAEAMASIIEDAG